MKNKNLSNQKLKLVASHALVIALFTNPYFIYVLADAYKIATNDTAIVVVNQSLTASMSLLSSIALLVSIVSFTLYALKKRAA